MFARFGRAPGRAFILSRHENTVRQGLKFSEIDWRAPSTRRVLLALYDGLAGIKQDLDGAIEDYERDEALDHAEALLGMAFLTAQIYIAGTVGDVNRITGSKVRLTKEHLLKQYGKRVPNTAITELQLIDAIANYFKHHDEGSNWSAMGQSQKTLSILRAAGISETYPCLKVADFLCPGDVPDVGQLVSIIRNWRKMVIDAHKE